MSIEKIGKIMANWRHKILDEFAPNVSKITLVADPDCLLKEEKLSMELKNRGFNILEFDDSVEFRFAHESLYRVNRDREVESELIVNVRLSESELQNLPYDLYQAGRKLSFSLGKLFPKLNNLVLEQLDTNLLDTLYDAQMKSPHLQLGTNQTKDYILRNVFGIAMESITSEVELLRVLMRVHYSQIEIPTDLSLRLVEVLKNNNIFNNWNLKLIVLDSNQFFKFIQERWPIFVKEFFGVSQSKVEQHSQRFSIDGPAHLPFDHKDIRVYIDNLFIEGLLKPIEFSTENKKIEIDKWMHCGISSSKEQRCGHRILRLIEIFEKIDMSIESNYTDWKSFAMKWAELSALMHLDNISQHKEQFLKLGLEKNELFKYWLESHFSSLINLPPTKPIMLHQVSRYLAREYENNRDIRIALIVIDGLSLSQWITIRNILKYQNSDLTFSEDSAFSWIPTITSVSRQSIFRGKPPMFFSQSIYNNNNEERSWKLFWEEYGISRSDVAYLRGLDDGYGLIEMENKFNLRKIKILGLVVNKVDEIMHGMKLGSSGMHNQIIQWCNNGFLIDLINILIDNEFEIFITSDHGNIESVGIGHPREGTIAEIRGKRVRIYPSSELREGVASTQSCAYKWEPVGLPKDYFPLVATNGKAFTKEGETIVGHGGITIEEVIVPFVKVEKDQ